jgi:hypothetical protein
LANVGALQNNVANLQTASTVQAGQITTLQTNVGALQTASTAQAGQITALQGPNVEPVRSRGTSTDRDIRKPTKASQWRLRWKRRPFLRARNYAVSGRRRYFQNRTAATAASPPASRDVSLLGRRRARLQQRRGRCPRRLQHAW